MEPAAQELAQHQDVADQSLAAPAGWSKKINFTKTGRKEVCFVAPDGEQIKSKQQLTRYLKSHAGGPSANDFDWTTGETATRRSTRISLKTPASASHAEPPKKRAKRKNEKHEEKTEPEQTDKIPEEMPLTDGTEVKDGQKVPNLQPTEDETKVEVQGDKPDQDVEDVNRKEDLNVSEEPKEKEKTAEITCEMNKESIVSTDVDTNTVKERGIKIEVEKKSDGAGEVCQVSKEDEGKTSVCSPKCAEATKMSMPLGIST